MIKIEFHLKGETFMRYFQRILVILLAISVIGNIFLLKSWKDADVVRFEQAKTVQMTWPFDWKQLPEQSMQQELLMVPWEINQQIGLWLFGVDSEEYEALTDQDAAYIDVMTQYFDVLAQDGYAKPGIYRSKRDRDKIFVCTFYKGDGTYTGYTMQYRMDEKICEMQKKEVRNGIVIALE